MSDANDAGPATGTALLHRLRRQLAAQRNPALFRVVETAHGADGRLVRRGQVWHADLDHVRRFGRALAANAATQPVLVKDAAGTTLEAIAAAPQAAAAGWAGWRDAPLPPLPQRQHAQTAHQALPAPAVRAAGIDIDPTRE